MPERASVYEQVIIAPETTPGTAPTTGYKTLASLKVEPSISIEIPTFTPSGYKLPTVAAPTAEFTTAKVTGQPTFEEEVYPLASILSTPVITTPGGATLTRNWQFDLLTSSADAYQTYAMEMGSSLRAETMVNAELTEYGYSYGRKSGVQSSGALQAQLTKDDKVRWLLITGAPTGGTFTITVGAQTTAGIAFGANAATIQTALEALSNVDPGDVTVTGSAGVFRILFKGQYAAVATPTVSASGASLTGGSSPAATTYKIVQNPTALALHPLLGNQIDFYNATTMAGLAGAPVAGRAISAGWKITNRRGQVWTMNTANDSYAASVETLPGSEFTMRVAADDEGMAYLNTARQGTLSFFRIKVTGPVIETGFNYLHQTDLAVFLTKVGDRGDEGGLVVREYTGVIGHDPTSGRGIRTTVRNLATAL